MRQMQRTHNTCLYPNNRQSTYLARCCGVARFAYNSVLARWEDKEDLMGDFTSVITSFCARVYGLRRNRRSTEKILEELRKEKE